MQRTVHRCAGCGIVIGWRRRYCLACKREREHAAKALDRELRQFTARGGLSAKLSALQSQLRRLDFLTERRS